MDSILSQSFSSIKVIVVNDGSTDETSNIINEYKSKDQRVFLFDIKNSGVAIARNFGMSFVDSDFICFVDSDDCLEINYIESMYKQAMNEESDIVLCDYNIVKLGIKSTVNTYIDGDSGSYIKAILAHGVWGVVWNKMFRTKFLVDNKIKFIDGFDFWEDLYFCINSLSHNPSISHVAFPLYNYEIRENSLVNSDISEKKVKSKIKVVEGISQLKNFSTVYKKELDAIKLHSKKEYLTNLKLYNPEKWKRAVPVSLNSIVNAEMSIKDKVPPVLAVLKFHFIIYIFIFFKMLIKKYSGNNIFR